jgi:hypothetical protein
MLIQRKNKIVFNLIHFNLEIWIQFNSIETQLNFIWIQFNFLIQIQLRCIQLKLHVKIYSILNHSNGPYFLQINSSISLIHFQW